MTLLFIALLLYGCILDVYAASVVRLVSKQRYVNITYRWLRILKFPLLVERWNWGRSYLEFLDSRTVCFPLIELYISLCLKAVIEYRGLTVDAMALTVFLTALVINAAVDHELGIFPDNISLPLIGAGLVFGILTWPIEGSPIMLNRIGGGSLGFLSSYGIATGYRLLTRKDGLGGGDIKMWTAIGFFLGIKSFLYFIFAFSIIGTINGLFQLLLVKRRYFTLRIYTGVPYMLAIACVLLFPAIPDLYFDLISKQSLNSPLALETFDRFINNLSFGAGVGDGR
jgi:prepilin signal peptidase PulO-like enzyme (type II secretory pathway)